MKYRVNMHQTAYERIVDGVRLRGPIYALPCPAKHNLPTGPSFIYSKIDRYYSPGNSLS